MSISMEYYYSRLIVIRLLYKAALLLSCIIRWPLLLFKWPVMLQDGRATNVADDRSAVSASTVRKNLQVTTYGEITKITEGFEEETTATTCAVCLSRVESRDKVWELRNCCHVFHKGCLDRWLDHDEHMTCPLCRLPLVTQAQAEGSVSTASSEPSWAVEQLLYLFGDDLLLN